MANASIKTEHVVNDPDADLRRRWKANFKNWNEAGVIPRFMLTEAGAALRCGARTKGTGLPCRRMDLYANGRCKLHGGPSTGPKTPEGKARALENIKKPMKVEQKQE